MNMIIVKKWLLVFGVLTPFALYCTNFVWQSLESSPAIKDINELDKDRLDSAGKMGDVIVKAEKAKKNIQSAAMFEPPVDKTPFKDFLTGRASVVKNAVAMAEGREPQVDDGKGIMGKFVELKVSQKTLEDRERDLKDWFNKIVGDDAKKARDEFMPKCTQYRDAGASNVKVAEYQLRGSHRIAIEFSKRLEKRYNDLVEKAVLPTKMSDYESLNNEIKQLAEILEEFILVHSNAPDQARKNPLIEDLANAMDRCKEEWQTRDALSKHFSIDPVRISPADVADWFNKLGAFMSKLSTSSTRDLIKQKVQQFCGVVIPEKLALDGHVYKVDGTLFRRDQLRARFKKVNAKPEDMDLYKRLALSLDPSELNERTQGDQKFSPPGYEPSMIDTPDGPVPSELFKPTPRSAAAFDFFKARQQVPLENGWKRVVVDLLLEAAAESEKKPDQQWDPLSLPGEAKQKPYQVVKKLNAIRAAMTNVATQSLFPDR